MTLRTPLCDLLGIEHPIVQSGMGTVAGPDLVAEVCKAGGLGIIAGLNLTPEQIRDAIRRVRAATDRPFGVNLFMPNEIRPPTDPATIPAATVAAVQSTLNGFRQRLGLPTTTERPPAVPDLIDGAFEVIVDERVPVWSIGLGDPGPELVRRCHGRGMKVMAMVTTVEDARTLERQGVDLLVAQGSEAGGHRSTGRRAAPELAGIGTLTLVPQVVDAVRVPMIAAGGADGAAWWPRRPGRGRRAAGHTRFVATREANVPEFRRRRWRLRPRRPR
jgi:nitronate monooxygenase